MSYRNSQQAYGRVAKWLHWTTAILFLLLYVSVYYRHWFTEKQTAENLIALHLHLSFGVSVAVIVLMRLIWRTMNVQPQMSPGPIWQHRLAHGLHYVLYAVMILMPLSGYIGTGIATKFFYLFEIPKFADTWLFDVLVWDYLGLTFEEFEAPVDLFHKEIMGESLLWILILGHAMAAFYHHFRLKDDTLKKML